MLLFNFFINADIYFLPSQETDHTTDHLKDLGNKKLHHLNERINQDAQY